MKTIRLGSIPFLLALAGCAGASVETKSAPQAISAGSVEQVVGPAAAAATITVEDVHQRLSFLASDEMRGRDTPSPELDRAAAYIAAEFERMGLEPAGVEGYYQYYALERRAVDAEKAHASFTRGGKTTTLRYGADFFAAAGVPATVNGEVVFTGTAIAEGASLDGKVALTYLPGQPDARTLSRTAGSLVEAAEKAEASAVVFILGPEVGDQTIAQLARLNAEEPRRLSVGDLETIPAIFISNARGKEILSGAGLDAGKLLVADAPAQVTAVAGTTAQVGAPARVYERHIAPNVVAVLPGSDPVLKNEYVVFSAHFDHVGVGQPDASGDSIYNGADDNASGTTGLLEVAEAFASLSEAPARSLVFLAVSGEEKGLLGSRYYSDHPTLPIEQTVANINVDMIGRNAPDSIVVIGQEYSSLGPLVREVAAAHPELGLTVARDLWPEQRFFFRSDHFNFARKDIPALFFFAGVHEDYHRPSDEVENIDLDKTTRVARLIFYTAYEIANRPTPPQWTEEGLREMRGLIQRGR